MENPRQGYGELKINLISLTDIDFNKSLVLKRFVNPFITESAEASHRLYFRVSFYDFALCKISSPINFSE